ncbi:MAG: hypothetical protein BWK80_39905 [Desulfobacteraceae bacterium IS3]|nr:MAG: hypothetical protein BWK80_39905 [Desulfobacteraceae bacterium IS3]
MNTAEHDFIPKKEIYRIRIAKTVDTVMKEDDIFREELNRDKVIEFLISIMQKFSVEDFLGIDDAELKKRISRLMAWNMLSKLLDDFTPEQKRIFNEAVRGV